MLTPGWSEIIVIMVVMVFVFGAKRLPEMGKSLGEGIREFKKSISGDYEESGSKEEKKPKIEESSPNGETKN